MIAPFFIAGFDTPSDLCCRIRLYNKGLCPLTPEFIALGFRRSKKEQHQVLLLQTSNNNYGWYQYHAGIFGEVNSTPYPCKSKFQSEVWDNWNLFFQLTGIKVYNAFYEPNNVADFAVMSMLILLRKAKVSICRALVNDFSLDGMKGREMRSMTVGVIGTGKIGATVVRNLSGFGCKILAYDPYENAKLKEYATYVDLDTLYHESDIITLHTPLTSDNYHMINKESIEKMKDGVIIINTARGALIDTDDLIDALESEKVGGAGIDTLEEEQGIMHVHVGTQIMNNKRSLLYIKQFPNVLYTQHYGFFTEEAIMSMVTCGITSLQDGFYGRESRCEVK